MDSSSVAGPSRTIDQGPSQKAYLKPGRPRATTTSTQATQVASPTPTAVTTMSSASALSRKVRTVPRMFIAPPVSAPKLLCSHLQRRRCSIHQHQRAKANQRSTRRVSSFQSAVESVFALTGPATMSRRRTTRHRPAMTSRHGGLLHSAEWPNFVRGTSAQPLLIQSPRGRCQRPTTTAQPTLTPTRAMTRRPPRR